MWHGIVVCLALAGADEVTVKPLNREVVHGTLTALTEKSVTVHSARGEEKWEAAALLSVKPAGSKMAADGKDASDPGVLVELLDGSLLPGGRWTLAAGQGVLESPDGKPIEVPARTVRSIKFRQQDDIQRKQWDAIAAGTAAGDQLVVRKAGPASPNSSPAAIVLDQLDGIVHAVTSATVAFEFDGDKIDVPLEKVEGILLRNRQPTTYPEAACRVRDSLGGDWQLQHLQLKAGMLNFQTVSGVRGEFPWARVREIDYSSGNLTFLSDLKSESVQWRPYLVTPATPPALAKWFSLRRDQATDGSVLTLGGESYEKGLALHSRTVLTYRFTRNYQRFQAVAGIDDRFRGPASLKLVISGDERTLLAREIRGNDPSYDVDLDLNGVRRLKILVDFGDDHSDAGDYLLLCNARLLK